MVRLGWFRPILLERGGEEEGYYLRKLFRLSAS